MSGVDDDDGSNNDASSSSPTSAAAAAAAAAIPVDPLLDFDMTKSLTAIENDSPAAAQQLLKDETELTDLRQSVVRSSRRNFVLERELHEIDEKIKLLVKNRITVQEAQASMRATELEEEGKGVSPLQGKKMTYEDLFYLLQSKTRYFAKLARLLNQSGDVASFVQTVVFDMYGDQYDTREERLLLDLFKKTLKAEITGAASRGSLLRANTAITQMLSAYAKRGQGLSTLKSVLGDPLQKMTAQKDLNMEIDPMKVYTWLIQEQETKTGQACDWDRNVTGQDVAGRDDVQAVIMERKALLERWAATFLQRIVDGVDQIPYGMRWICKQLGSLCVERFPDSDRYGIGSLMGGYIYLRYFNPVIVNPDGSNFIKSKPSRIMRRNLILVAKVLQNMSNGLLFGDKEQYMKILNPFVLEKREVLLDYFDKLIMVDDLGDSLQVDKYLEHTKVTANTIQISYNQIFLVHSLLEQHIEVVAPQGMDQVRRILKELGPAPKQLDRKDNRTVILTLQDRRESRLSTAADAFATSASDSNPLYFQAKSLLLSVLRLLPHETKCESLETFLDEEKMKALSEQDSSLSDHITNVKSMLHTLSSMGLLRNMGDTQRTFDFFLWEMAKEAMERSDRVTLVRKRLKMCSTAIHAIQNHHEYLQQRLELYKMYLDNVRKGNADKEAVGQSSKDKKKKKEKIKVVKVSHPELQQSGVIVSVDESVLSNIINKCTYHFQLMSPGIFEITLHIKKGFDMKLTKKPIVINLEDLLTMQEHGQMRLPLDYVDLNVNLLIHFLNTKFL